MRNGPKNKQNYKYNTMNVTEDIMKNEEFTKTQVDTQGGPT